MRLTVDEFRRGGLATVEPLHIAQSRVGVIAGLAPATRNWETSTRSRRFLSSGRIPAELDE
jgi:hypothetical protein